MPMANAPARGRFQIPVSVTRETKSRHALKA
jgi:hypothetical protein